MGFLSVVGGVVIAASALGFVMVLALTYTTGLTISIGIAGLELIVGIYLGYVGIKIDELQRDVNTLFRVPNSATASSGPVHSYYSERALAIQKELEQKSKNQSHADEPES